MIDIFIAMIWKTEPLYHIWLREMAPGYIAFNMEQTLIDRLPGYTPQQAPNDHHDATPMSAAAYGVKDVVKDPPPSHDDSSDDGLAKVRA